MYIYMWDYVYLVIYQSICVRVIQNIKHIKRINSAVTLSIGESKAEDHLKEILKNAIHIDRDTSTGELRIMKWVGK